MKLFIIVMMLWFGCGPTLRGVKDTQHRSPKLYDFAAELSQTSRKHDVDALRKLMHDHVTIGGMWFEDVKCLTQFGTPARITGPVLEEFSRCLATLELAPSSRTDALPNCAILTYGSGLEIEACFVELREGPWLNWIGYVARRDRQDALPTVSAAALEALRVEGDPQAPPADPGTFDELTIMQHAFAWLKVCINSSGTVTTVHVREASSPKAARVFAAAAQTWKFHPFMLRMQPTPVCAMVSMRDPAGPPPKGESLPLPLPWRTDAVVNLPNQALGQRVAGTMMPPDGADMTRTSQADIGGLRGAVHFCMDETGSVNQVALIRSTGVKSLDRSLLAAVSTWAYQPYLDEGGPVAVCSWVQFAYSQP